MHQHVVSGPVPPPPSRAWAGLTRYLHTPDYLPGVNDFSRLWQPGRRLPVVLLHGTFFNFAANFSFLAPVLLRQGHPVFGVNYGRPQWSLGGRLGGLRGVAECASEVADFVGQVLCRTGAPAVNLVGHSLGGLVAAYYLKRGAGRHTVDRVVSVAPTTHGTDVSGEAKPYWAPDWVDLLTDPFARAAPRWGCAALADQMAGSPLLADLWQDGTDMPTEARYLTVMTAEDTSVVPVSRQALAGDTATAVVVQDICPENKVCHRTIILDDCVARLTHQFLAGESLGCPHRTQDTSVVTSAG